MSVQTDKIARLLYHGLNFNTAIHYLSMCLADKEMVWEQSKDHKNISCIYCQEKLYIIRIMVDRYIPAYMACESTNSQAAMNATYFHLKGKGLDTDGIF